MSCLIKCPHFKGWNIWDSKGSRVHLRCLSCSLIKVSLLEGFPLNAVLTTYPSYQYRWPVYNHFHENVHSQSNEYIVYCVVAWVLYIAGLYMVTLYIPPAITNIITMRKPAYIYTMMTSNWMLRFPVLDERSAFWRAEQTQLVVRMGWFEIKCGNKIRTHI